MKPRSCPRCRERLVHETWEGIVVDRCAKCDGFWFDLRELRQLLEQRKARASGIPVVAEEVGPDGSASCPDCGTTMDRVVHPGSGVTLDRCARHGTWLDRGELGRLEAAVVSGRAPMPADGATGGGSWACLACNARNDAANRKCRKCGADRATGEAVGGTRPPRGCGETVVDFLLGMLLFTPP